jgi:recombination protein RecA
MSRPPGAAARRAAVEALLRDLGPRLRRGGLVEPPPERLPTGIAAVDRILGGGFPRGRLSEVTGPASSGRTSLALALLAHATAGGEVCAVVDAADGFDPRAAQTAGVALERVLWARASDLRNALRATSRLLEAEGFGLVLLDLAAARLRPPAPLCARLARVAAGTHTALVALGLERAEGASAEIVLEMRAARAHFTGTPSLLEALEVEARLLRQRSAPASRCARVRLPSPAA